MATASSAQREPSMEEILASIRRIIEDSDSGRKQADEAIKAIEQDEAPAPVVDAFRTELHAPTVEARPITLADVQAGLSAANAMSTREDQTTRPVPTLAEIGAQAAAEQAEVQLEAANADAITADWQRDIAVAGAPARDTAEAVAAELDHSEKSNAGEAAEATSVSHEPAYAQAEPLQPVTVDDMVGRSTLISEQTSRQVAAAFGELSEAFASRGRKNFDEMAEEMLRPMLQDWLDNNLPTLVERLVREEIERVARGG